MLTVKTDVCRQREFRGREGKAEVSNSSRVWAKVCDVNLYSMPISHSKVKWGCSISGSGSRPDIGSNADNKLRCSSSYWRPLCLGKSPKYVLVFPIKSWQKPWFSSPSEQPIQPLREMPLTSDPSASDPRFSLTTVPVGHVSVDGVKTLIYSYNL